MIDILHKKYLTFYLAFCVWFLWPSLLLSATLSGTLSEDEIWAGSLQLTGDVTVPVGITLTITT